MAPVTCFVVKFFGLSFVLTFWRKEMEIFCSFLWEMDRSYSLWFLLGYHFCFFENVKTSPLVHVREVVSLSVHVCVCARE